MHKMHNLTYITAQLWVPYLYSAYTLNLTTALLSINSNCSESYSWWSLEVKVKVKVMLYLVNPGGKGKGKGKVIPGEGGGSKSSGSWRLSLLCRSSCHRAWRPGLEPDSPDYSNHTAVDVLCKHLPSVIRPTIMTFSHWLIDWLSKA